MDPATEQRIASVPTLDDIARDPGCAGGLPPRTLAALQSRAAIVQAALAAEALAAATETAQVRASMPAPAAGLLTAKQMAEYLKVPESWVRSEARADRIPKRMVGRYVRFDASEVERALSQRRVACR
ncbi:helix-turn-helix domain-containing protein [Candidatus Binatus sp.]|uniref:helix-turn-helix domain-containing protein n=1 Tax=Candidatus Binatus sp. TaxID=2811406 RepID=UPI002F9378A8